MIKGMGTYDQRQTWMPHTHKIFLPMLLAKFLPLPLIATFIYCSQPYTVSACLCHEFNSISQAHLYASMFLQSLLSLLSLSSLSWL